MTYRDNLIKIEDELQKQGFKLVDELLFDNGLGKRVFDRTEIEEDSFSPRLVSRVTTLMLWQEKK